MLHEYVIAIFSRPLLPGFGNFVDIFCCLVFFDPMMFSLKCFQKRLLFILGVMCGVGVFTFVTHPLILTYQQTMHAFNKRLPLPLIQSVNKENTPTPEIRLQ